MGRAKNPPASPAAKSGVYVARQSNKTAGLNVASDGVVWKERLAVVEGVTPEGNPKLHIRSYFRNPQTRERAWDEPPSGASRVDFATPEMRQLAEQQMKELQFTLDLIPPDHASQQTTKQEKPKKGFFKRLKGKNKDKAILKDDSKDLNLQRAIALSMADQQGGGGVSRSSDSDPRILFDSEFSQPTLNRNTTANVSVSQEDEDLAMAKALSLAALNGSPAANSMSDDEMLALAIKQSTEEMHSVPPTVAKKKKNGVPATAFPRKSPPSTLPPAAPEKIDVFDPYSPRGNQQASTRSSTPTTARSSTPTNDVTDIQKSKGQEDNDREKPGRSMSRKMFGSRKRMEAEAGVL